MSNVKDSQSPTATIIGQKEKTTATMKIDWLTLKFVMKGEEAEQIVPTLVGYLEDEHAIYTYGVVRGGAKLSNAAKIAFQFVVPKSQDPNTTETRPVASVRVKKSKTGEVAAFVDIHPPGLTPYGSEFVHGYLLRCILNRSPAEISAAKVTRIDVALDLPAVTLGDFAWDVRGKKVRRPYLSGLKLRSIGFGSPKHGSVSVYDKSGDGSEAPLTRIEARMKPGCSLAQVACLASPFARIDATDVHAAWKALGRHPIEASAMLSHAQLRGLTAVPTLFPSTSPIPYAKAVAKALSTATPPWWNPIGVWQEFPGALASALPAVFGDNAVDAMPTLTGAVHSSALDFAPPDLTDCLQ